MRQLADLVNPYIGTISHMLQSTRPEVMLPYGMARSTPVVNECGDYYCNNHICGYSVGKAIVMPGKAGDYVNTLDHSREDFKCYYLKMELEENNIVAESTVTHHVYLHRFAGADCLKLSFSGGTAEIVNGAIRLLLKSEYFNYTANQYVILKLDSGIKVKNQKEDEWELEVPESVVCCGAVSYISFEKAEESLNSEVGDAGFDEIAEKAKEIWNNQLGKVIVEGNTEDKQIVFYTALYRAFQRMTDYTEHGEYFSAYDSKVHKGTFYTGDGLWDTFRCMHPLQLLLDTVRHEDILESYNLMYKQSGLMPSFPGHGGDLPVMIGFHAASLFADAKAKGIKADYETAYEGIRKNATEETMLPWRCGVKATELDQCYYEKGFFPALAQDEEETCAEAHPFEKRQAVAVTLEHAYDDWCAAQLAEKLGKNDDYMMFSKRAKNYAVLFNEDIGFMAPKDINGSWIKDFNPKLSGGMGGREYTAENNTYTYTWSVFHDIEGLSRLMGGHEAAVKKLDNLFCEGFDPKMGSKYTYLGQFPDSTGLMGQFAMGNEPSFHIPYLYNYFGSPWKAQKKIRELMDIWFTNQPTGICGDEDGGAMSSWFVFSALGFYPVCPGKAEYAIGTPLFDKAQIKLENGKTFSVKSSGAGKGMRYIQSAYLNGKKFESPFLTHQDIMNGGDLCLEMGSRPSDWFKYK